MEAEAGQIREFRLIGTVWFGDPIGIKLVNQEDSSPVVVIGRNSGGQMDRFIKFLDRILKIAASKMLEGPAFRDCCADGIDAFLPGDYADSPDNPNEYRQTDE